MEIRYKTNIRLSGVMAMTVITVEDMSCEHCVQRITRALQSVGLNGFTVDLEGRRVLLASDDQGTVDAAVGVILEAGYNCRIGG